MNVKSPISSVRKFVFNRSTREPSVKKLMDIKRTFPGEMAPDGIGLCLVLSIRRSVFLSW